MTEKKEVTPVVQPIKRYTPEELAEKRRAEQKRNAERLRREKENYYGFYDDIKTNENPSW